MKIRIMKKRENESFLRKRTRLFFNFTFANLMSPLKFFKNVLLIPFFIIAILIADELIPKEFVTSIADFLFRPALIVFNQIFPPNEFYILSAVLAVSVTLVLLYKSLQFISILIIDFLASKYFKKDTMLLDNYDY